MDMTERYFVSAKVASLLRVRKKTIGEYRKRGLLPAVRIGWQFCTR
jgi:hypothetical protein